MPITKQAGQITVQPITRSKPPRRCTVKGRKQLSQAASRLLERRRGNSLLQVDYGGLRGQDGGVWKIRPRAQQALSEVVQVSKHHA